MYLNLDLDLDLIGTYRSLYTGYTYVIHMYVYRVIIAFIWETISSLNKYLINNNRKSFTSFFVEPI